MKILYIPSGYKHIYKSFDDSIIRALRQSNHQVRCTSSKNADDLKRTVLTFQPELALTMVGFKMPPSIIQLLKKNGIRLAIWLTEDPYYIDRTIKLIHEYDYVFTIEYAALDVYKESGHEQVYYLPLGTDPNIFRPIILSKKHHCDICLVGYPYPDRIQLIIELLKNTDYSIRVVGKQWEKAIPNSRRYANLSVLPTWIPPEEVVTYYNSAAINLNTHRPYHLKQNKNARGVINQSINNRTFDIASCGAFQLIKFKPDLYQHFIEGEEIVSFKSSEELIEKIHYYMSAEEKRLRIAKNGRERVLRAHTFVHRLDEMLSLLQE